MKKLLGLLLALASAVVLAAGASANLTWTAPTNYTDGTTLPASDIAFYTITYTKAGAPASLNVNAPALSAAVAVACGSTNFSITVTTTSTAAYPNTTSAPNGPVPYASGVTCVPNAPGNFKAS